MVSRESHQRRRRRRNLVDGAFHLSIAAVNWIQCSVTWNYRHIANAETAGIVEQVYRDCGAISRSLRPPRRKRGMPKLCWTWFTRSFWQDIADEALDVA